MSYRYRYTGEGEIRTKAGNRLAEGHTRIVQGGRGAYVEIDPQTVPERSLRVPAGERWRLQSRIAYYIELRTVDWVKVYFQKRRVDYADYQVGMLYVSPVDLADFERDGRVDEAAEP